ncbi:MAG: OadG family protein [Clostridia bacterium]|nr:OadG family protein [Clostridia bacterium]
MLNNLMAIIQGDGSNWAGQQKSPNNFYFDNFGEAALYALIGFLVVFVGIVIIIAIIWLVGLIMRKTNNLEFLTKKREKKVKKGKEEQLTAAAVADEGDIPDEVKVAIMAAIMAYYQEREEKCEFTVKRIKRI